MRLKEAGIIVLASIVFPIIFIKAYKNQQIAENKVRAYNRAIRAQRDPTLDQDYIMINEVPAQ